MSYNQGESNSYQGGQANSYQGNLIIIKSHCIHIFIFFCFVLGGGGGGGDSGDAFHGYGAPAGYQKPDVQQAAQYAKQQAEKDDDDGKKKTRIF